MLLLKLVFSVGLRVAGPPSDWTTLAGADKIEYRWSRPANNSCLVEFRSLDPAGGKKFTAVATVVDNFVPPTKAPPKRSNSGPPPQPTKVKEHRQDRAMLIQIVASGTTVQSFDGCYNVVIVRAEDVSASASSKDGSSASAAKDNTDTGVKDTKRKPEQ